MIDQRKETTLQALLVHTLNINCTKATSSAKEHNEQSAHKEANLEVWYW